MEISSPSYGKVVNTMLDFNDAIDAVKALLKDEGFGLLCEIDVTKTLHEKTGADFRPYRILGACNPTLAHRALSTESQLGLLLPCNMVVQVQDGRTIVSAIDAHALLSVVGGKNLGPVADEVNARFNRVLDRVAKI
jgi:uncharacterized protein (DUF302 family)